MFTCTPSFLATVAAGAPASSSLSAATICASLNLDFFTVRSPWVRARYLTVSTGDDSRTQIISVKGALSDMLRRLTIIGLARPVSRSRLLCLNWTADLPASRVWLKEARRSPKHLANARGFLADAEHWKLDGQFRCAKRSRSGSR